MKKILKENKMKNENQSQEEKGREEIELEPREKNDERRRGRTNEETIEKK